jgi:signal transduction histidine kinase
LNFNSSQNNEYAYWLEGFEYSWVMSGRQRTATYTNLNPGQYIFKVKASNNDNVWNEKGASIKVIIKPPFWATWWFNTLIISLLFLLLYLIYRWRTNRSRNKYLLLEETVKQRTSELKEANEQLETFVYKASHDIKGPLRSIIGLTTIGQKDVKDETALNYFDHILKSTKKLDMLLRDLLEVTKVKQATIQKKHIHFNDLVTEVYRVLKIYLDLKK